MNRRKFIASSGALAGGLTVGRASAAIDTRRINSFISDVKNASRIRRRYGDWAWKAYLRDAGYKLETKSARASLSAMKADSGSIRTQKFQNVDGDMPKKAGIEPELALVKSSLYRPVYFAELSWRYYWDTLDEERPPHEAATQSFGEAPIDVAAIVWQQPCWDMAHRDSYSESTYVSHPDYVRLEKHNLGANMGFEIDDRAITERAARRARANGNGVLEDEYSDRYAAGVFLTEDDDPDCNDDDDTMVGAMYDHTWNGRIFNWRLSANFGSTGVNIAVTYSSDKTIRHEETMSEGDGDTPLTIRRSEVE